MEETLLPKNEITELKESQENQISETANQKPISIGKGIWDIVWKFLLAYGLFIIIPLIYVIIYAFLSKEKILESTDWRKDVLFDIVYRWVWCTIITTTLGIIIFTKMNFVKISFGRIKKQKILPLMAVTPTLAISYMCFEISCDMLLLLSGWLPEELIDVESDLDLIITPSTWVLGLLLVGILGPIFEEIMCRGILIGGLRKIKCPVWTSIILSGIIFGALHGMIIKFVGCTIFGIITGWLYCRTRSLIPGIVMHIINNSIVVGFGLLVYKYSSLLDTLETTEPTPEETKETIIFLAITTAISLAAIIGCLWWLNKKLPKDKEEISNENLSVQTI
ncbi:MAG: CPBP family intramembrane metalloprotease [Bacteroidaceae bacterium]|nr:CPBP family intramembrane metalloprotease [Bacteroidaceae bacterium]